MKGLLAAMVVGSAGLAGLAMLRSPSRSRSESSESEEEFESEPMVKMGVGLSAQGRELYAAKYGKLGKYFGRHR